jgi:hypothetical protein
LKQILNLINVWPNKKFQQHYKIRH